MKRFSTTNKNLFRLTWKIVSFLILVLNVMDFHGTRKLNRPLTACLPFHKIVHERNEEEIVNQRCLNKPLIL